MILKEETQEGVNNQSCHQDNLGWELINWVSSINEGFFLFLYTNITLMYLYIWQDFTNCKYLLMFLTI